MNSEEECGVNFAIKVKALGPGVALNDHGLVAFRGYTDSFFNMGIFTVTPAGQVSTIAFNDAEFSDMGALPAINNGGRVEFFAHLKRIFRCEFGVIN
jgi:hypothetical protein